MKEGPARWARRFDVRMKPWMMIIISSGFGLHEKHALSPCKLSGIHHKKPLFVFSRVAVEPLHPCRCIYVRIRRIRLSFLSYVLLCQ